MELALLPFVLVALALAVSIEPVIGTFTAAGVAIAVPAFLIGWIRKHRGGDPLVLYGRVWSSWQGENAHDAQDVAKDRLFAHTEGTAHRIAVTMRAAAFIRQDGSLAAAPDWRGRKVLNTTARLLRGVGDGEHLVLVATQNGHVLARLADVAGLRHPAPFPRRRLLKSEAELHTWLEP